MNNFDFLTNEQVNGNNALDIFQIYGPKCAITDFAILLGGHVHNNFYINDNHDLRERASWYWTKTINDYSAYMIDIHGISRLENITRTNGGIRPILPLSNILPYASNLTDMKEVLYGEYPQWVVDNTTSLKLEEMYNADTLLTTRKRYITELLSYSISCSDYVAVFNVEYEYNGEKYLRFMGKPLSAGKTLSNGENIIEKKYYWLKVEPLTWLIAEKSNIAISKNIIFSGLPFNKLTNLIKDFNHTDIKRCMDLFLIKDIEPSISIEDKKLISDKLSLVRKK